MSVVFVCSFVGVSSCPSIEIQVRTQDHGVNRADPLSLQQLCERHGCAFPNTNALLSTNMVPDRNRLSLTDPTSTAGVGMQPTCHLTRNSSVHLTLSCTSDSDVLLVMFLWRPFLRQEFLSVGDPRSRFFHKTSLEPFCQEGATFCQGAHALSTLHLLPPGLEFWLWVKTNGTILG